MYMPGNYEGLVRAALKAGDLTSGALLCWSWIGNTWPVAQTKVEERNRRIAEMMDTACTRGEKGSGTHVRPLQALNLVKDGCERVSTDRLSHITPCYHAECLGALREMIACTHNPRGCALSPLSRQATPCRERQPAFYQEPLDSCEVCPMPVAAGPDRPGSTGGELFSLCGGPCHSGRQGGRLGQGQVWQVARVRFHASNELPHKVISRLTLRPASLSSETTAACLTPVVPGRPQHCGEPSLHTSDI